MGNFSKDLLLVVLAGLPAVRWALLWRHALRGPPHVGVAPYVTSRSRDGSHTRIPDPHLYYLMIGQPSKVQGSIRKQPKEPYEKHNINV